MKGGSNDTSKCTVQAKHGRNGKVVFANLPRLGYSLAYMVRAIFKMDADVLLNDPVHSHSNQLLVRISRIVD